MLRQTSKFSNQSGQVAVVILLVLTVLLTVAVSMAVRTTDEIKLATQQSEATRVFNAAETGVERALLEGTFGSTVFTDTPDTAGANTTYTIYPSNAFEASADVGEAVSVNLTSGAEVGNVEIHWATEDNEADRASLIVALYYQDNSVDYFGVGPARSDDFELPSTSSVSDYAYSFEPNLNSGETLAMMRVIPVYNDTMLTITGDNIPVQQHTIRSEAINSIQDANEKRVIEVTRTLPSAPTFMDYAVYGKEGVLKN